MTETLSVDGRSLTLEQFLAVAREKRGVSLAADANASMATTRRSVERAVANGRAIYGVTTGFGGLSHKTISSAQARELQVSLVRSHASGTGPALPSDVVRGLVLL
ncbi:MAG: aromatic amino acid lyase, partial [Thermoplasmata archaeon]